MNIKVKDYLERGLDDYSKLVRVVSFIITNIRGNERIRRDFNKPSYGFGLILVFISLFY
jgi:hypothetical protein